MYLIISSADRETGRKHDVTICDEALRFAECYQDHIVRWGVAEDLRVYQGQELDRKSIQDLILMGDING